MPRSNAVREECSTCRFYRSTGYRYMRLDAVQSGIRRTCHRYAPRPSSNSGINELSWSFPEICDHQWCGEWEAKDVKE